MIGILDPDGIGLNPLNQKPYTEEYKKYSSYWRNIPAYKHIQDLIKMCSQTYSLVVSGTGSGKTVLAPKAALHSLGYNGKVVVCMPKRVIVEEAAKYAANCLDVQLGNEVGFAYKGKTNYKETTKLLFVTDGVLINYLVSNTPMNIVIIDEVHERKVQIDLNLALFKRYVVSNPKTKLMLMSADVDTYDLRKYFDLKLLELPGASCLPITVIDDHAIPVIANKSIDLNGMMNRALDLILQIFFQSDTTRILVFVPTILLCTKTVMILSSKNIKSLAIYSDSPDNLELDDESIRVFVATNVAESSLTIKNISHVIDTGMEVSKKYVYFGNYFLVNRQLISKAQIKQRMGRTGRTCPGVYYPLYKSTTMADYPVPAISISNIVKEVLTMIVLGVDIDNGLLTPINSKVYVSRLKEMGCLDYPQEKFKRTGEISVTVFGKTALLIPFTIPEARALINAYHANELKTTMKVFILLRILKNNYEAAFIDPKRAESIQDYVHIGLHMLLKTEPPDVLKTKLLKTVSKETYSYFDKVKTVINESQLPPFNPQKDLSGIYGELIHAIKPLRKNTVGQETIMMNGRFELICPCRIKSAIH